MKSIIEHFDRSYIINLSDRTDRRRQVIREFARIGYEIPNEKIQIYSATRPTDKAGFIDAGTRGNFTSHRNVLELAVRDGLHNVLIFEDDVSFRNVDAGVERDIITQLSQEVWDVVYFAYLTPDDESLKGPLAPWSKDVIGAHFYAVNGEFIRTMLQYMNECELRPRDHPDGGPMTADGAYNHIRYLKPNVRVLLSAPSLAHQRSSRTDVAPTKSFDRIVWLSPILGAIRHIKHWIRMAADNEKLGRK